MTPIRLFTLAGAHEHDPEVDGWFDSPPSELRRTAQKWFEAMRACGSDALVLLHDGHPTACVENLALGYVDAFRDHVNVGFFQGSSLEDPAGLLEGSGKLMRHVKVRPGVAMDEAALHDLITAACRELKARLALEGPGLAQRKLR